MKEFIGSFMSMMTSLIIDGGSASIAGIGLEDMPKSLKSKR
ncbi:MAG: hypothetical protein ACRC3Y_04245 [Romboutsia sp.]